MKKLVLQIFIVLMWSNSTTTGFAQAQFTAVAVTGQSAPTGGSGVTFEDLFQGAPPAINASDDVLFTGTLSGSGVGSTNDRALWFGHPGVLAMLAREGMTAPGTTVHFSNFSDHEPALADNGLIMFDASLAGPDVGSTNNKGIWVGRPGSLGLVVRLGDAPPDLGGSVYITSLLFTIGGAHYMTPGGQTAKNFLLGGSGVTAANDVSIHAGGTGGLTLTARENSQAPDVPVSARFLDLFNSAPVVNASGSIAFQARLAGTGVNVTNDWAIWRGQPSALTVAVREGQSTFDAGAGIYFTFFNAPVINSVGALAFSAGVGGAGVGTGNDFAIFTGPPGAMALVAREGSPAPDSSGALFGDLFTIDPVLNNQGDVAFNCTLTGAGVDTSNDTGIWARRDGTLGLIAREGNRAPGTADGITFGDFRFIGPMLNGRGQVAFAVNVFGPGVNLANDMGIWLTDSAGDLHLLVREGDAIQIAPGDTRTVRQLKTFVPGGEGEGNSTSFNAAGKLVFPVVFSDFTSAILVAELADVRPRLTIVPTVPGSARISWTPDAPGFILQQTMTLSPSDWTDAPSGTMNPATIPTDASAKFYRLFKP
jgi:hypothetical protein